MQLEFTNIRTPSNRIDVPQSSRGNLPSPLQRLPQCLKDRASEKENASPDRRDDALQTKPSFASLSQRSSWRFGFNLAIVFGCCCVIGSDAHAGLVSLTPTEDGDVRVFGGDDVDTLDPFVAMTQSGGLERKAVLEYDLSSIPTGSTIDSATLSLVKNGVFSNVGTDLPLHIEAYMGDGVVNINDFGAASTNVGDFMLSISPSVPPNGTVFDFALTDVVPLQTALDSPGQLLTLRLETDSFATMQFASLEAGGGFAAPTLDINFSSSVPEPSALALLPFLGVIFFRRKKS